MGVVKCTDMSSPLKACSFNSFFFILFSFSIFWFSNELCSSFSSGVQSVALDAFISHFLITLHCNLINQFCNFTEDEMFSTVLTFSGVDWDRKFIY